MSQNARYRHSSGRVVSQRGTPAVWRAGESDIEQGLLVREKKILKVPRTGAISLPPCPFPLLIQKSWLSILANAGALKT